jgi:hypothetical protein
VTKPPYPGGYSRRNSHTSARKIKLREKQAAALEFRKIGHDYKTIAKHMKTSATTVFRWVTEELGRVAREPAQALLKMELERLDHMQSSVYSHAVQGDLAAIATVLKICDQRARLLGWYPKQPEFSMSIAGAAAESEARPKTINVVFCSPPPPSLPPVRPIDVTPVQPSPPYAPGRALPSPRHHWNEKGGWME